jgi:CTP:molybdopterin cytidylyltransferase MocA
VIAAAGASSRMLGPDGLPALKPLLPFRGSTLAGAAVAAAMGAGARVLLVVGKGSDRLRSAFSAAAYDPARREGRLVLVENPRWEEGMLGSIQAALPTVGGEAFFVALADMPFIASDSYLSLAERWAARARPAGAPPRPAAFFGSHGGRRGHPVLLPSSWMPAILALDPRGMLRDFVETRESVLVETGPGALRDLDTREDYLSAVAEGGGD